MTDARDFLFSPDLWRDILYADLHSLRNKTDEAKQELRSAWLRDFLYSSYHLPEQRETDTVFFRSLVRDDYKKLFHTVIEASGVRDRVVVEDYQDRTEPARLNAAASRYMLEHADLFNVLDIPDPLDRACCFVRACKYGFILDHFRKMTFKTLVCFADMQPVEHLLARYFRAQGRTTVTLQHGLYVDYSGMDTVNVINYKHQPSEYFLAWGQHTAGLIKAHNPGANTVICGKPDLARLSAPGTYAGSEKAEILVVMDQEIFQKKNVEMLRLVYGYAAQHGKDVRVRFHPQNNRAFYRKSFPGITEKHDITGASVVAGHTSSLLFEASAIGLPVVQFASDTPTIPLPDERRFTDAQSLDAAMQAARLPERAGDGQPIIEAIAYDSREKYRQFFETGRTLQKPPRFSVIVPTFNSGLHLATVLESVLNQSFADLEIIVSDGLSTDYTLQIAMDYAQEDARVKIFSGPDTGVYDAMNKGLQQATGDWIIFMGSDDEFADVGILEKVARFADAHPKAGMIYGSVRVVGDVKWAKDGTIYDGPFTTDKIKTKNICHQAIFYRRTDHSEIGEYNLKYKLCADWDMNLRFWAKKACEHIDLVIANFNAGGASTTGTDPEFGKDFAANKKKYFSEAGTMANV
ncbi:glycosyltransferase family 2 protein [Leisingera caerulea]|uniref:glycosyltransferase family 2 protein n=1 Tax=Leisingera caerulea TaxID=506591 RepID=UPI0021A81005|nr:glycosyltransferase family 2 protein [Leisingera caerulea]UWQ86103.1 glycosyltransferase [Leisingera caerulea]